MVTWDGIVDGFKKTFRVSDFRKPIPKTSVCRECEIIGSAASFTATAYVWHHTRTGNLMVVPGMFISSRQYNNVFEYILL